MREWHPAHLDVPRFDRAFFDGTERFTRIGSGGVGGKAAGLLFMREILADRFDAARFPAFDVAIPSLTVLTTEVFDEFIADNHLDEVVVAGGTDRGLAHAFQRASLPASLVGDLHSLSEKVRSPLAIRSSSLLEDDIHEPFAGVYATKMIPNNQLDGESRFRRLAEAIKCVWASTFLSEAVSYRRALNTPQREEKMAVIVQEVVGRRHGPRFYPDLSGVGRSFSFYRVGDARPEDGVLSLALGLGKTIVDGGLSWTYSPSFPAVTPPVGSVRELLRQTQVEFWAVNMGKPPAYDPIAETEYLLRASLAEAEEDGTLRFAGSTYDAASDRLSPGIGRAGIRLVTFAPLLTLEEFAFNDVMHHLLEVSQDALGAAVEVEIAATFEAGRARLGFLQVRPMAIADETVNLADADLTGPRVVVASSAAMGNGTIEGVRDVVFVKPETFEARLTPEIAREIETINRRLVAEGRRYLLVGFGRWGSSDPWLGIPVVWSQISGARAIVEVSGGPMNVQISQGAHFFHNLSGFRVYYYSIGGSGIHGVDWAWLTGESTVEDTGRVRHVRTGTPLRLQVDGRRGIGVVVRGESDP